MCKIHRIHYSINTLKNSVNKITECSFIFKKIGKYNCMHFFFCRVCIPSFVVIISTVLEKIFEGFLTYMGVAAILVM